MKLVLAFLVYVLLVSTASGWLFRSSSSRSSSSSSGGETSETRPHDIRTQSGLTSLYNKRVVNAERVVRPLGGSSNARFPIAHTGVRITTSDGERYLVHKGRDYGGSGGETVVTDARHMSDRWQSMGESRPVSSSSVSDFVRAGGRNYGTLTDNCHGASGRMMDRDRVP